MLPEGLSEAVLAFVQTCQVAVLTCADDDYVAQVTAIWNCLSTFPRSGSDCELVAAVLAVWKVASGFFVPHAVAITRRARPHTLQRAHVNAVLRLAMDRHHCPDMTLRQIASQLGLSVCYLSHAINAETEHSFASAFRAHLNGIRLLDAVKRLESAASVQSLALSVGYPRTGELDRQFDRWFGVSPGRFRSLLGRAPVLEEYAVSASGARSR